MRKPYLKLTIGIVIILLSPFISGLANGQHGWPIEAMNEGHFIGCSFGEFQDFGVCINTSHCVYQHSGIDILGTPKYDSNNSVDPAAPWVLVTVEGVVIDATGTCDNFQDQTDYNTTYSISIRDKDGLIYRYGHLQRCSYDPKALLEKANNGEKVTAGSPIAQLVRWYVCDFHHLHYDVEKNGIFINPLASITPYPDGVSPKIDAVFFAVNNSNPWDEIKNTNSEGYIVVSGEVDIIAQIRDRDRVGSDQALWVFNILWRACSESNPDCPWNNTYSFDEMPTLWNTQGNNPYTSVYFNVSDSWVSRYGYCLDQDTQLYAIVTHFVGGKPDKAGSWDTKAIPDGNYSVDVKAIDFAGNETTLTVNVFVNNGGPPGSPGGLRISGN